MPTDRTVPSTGAALPAGGPRPGRIASDRAGTVGRDLVDLVLPWAVALVTLVARLATAATGPTDWDSSQYAAAVTRFDITHGRPQPPGYFLYVEAGRLVHASGTGVVHSLVLVAAMASAAAAGLTVVAGRDLGGRWVGLAAGVLVATSPFVWFSGSIVATYSFDLLIAPLLIILAWRARPHSWHGAAALAALGLGAGFRQSVFQAFLLLALVAVAGSVRRVREGVVALGVGVVAVAAWFVPMVLAQPGGAAAWARATRSEALGAVRVTSVLDHASGGSTNLGTVAAYTTVAVAPLAALALASAALLGIRALFQAALAARAAREARRAADVAAPADLHAHTPRDPAGAATLATIGRPEAPTVWTRPWYQSRTVILVAAVVPPLSLVTLVQFAKGGYLLAYLPGAVIALLLAPAALLRDRPDRRRPVPKRSPVAAGAWFAVASLAVVAIAGLGVQRFLSGTGVLPVTPAATGHGLWLTQARYQAPYGATRSAIRTADSLDAALARLGPFVDPRRDVVVIDTVDGGSMFYRNAGWELPGQRVALIIPGQAIYNEQLGSLYYTSTTTVPVAPGGYVYLIAPPNLPGLARVTADLQAVPVKRAPTIADYRVWKVSPGASVLGVRVVARPGARPLGSGLSG